MKVLHTLRPLLAAVSLIGLSHVAQAADTIKIAIVQPMTGAVTQYGVQIQAGALTAIETINAKGGVLGKKLEPILIDDGCEPKQAIPAANKAINSGAKFALTHACSGVALAAAKRYDDEGIVAITPGATNPSITDSIKPHFFFRTIGRDDQQGPFAAQYIANKIKPQKVFIIHDKQTYGEGIAKQVRDSLKKLNVNIIAYEGINAGESDYSAIVTKIKGSGADLVYFGGYHGELGLLLRQSREQGVKTLFMAPEGTANLDLVRIAGPAIEGLLVTLPADFTAVPANAGIVKAFKDKKRDPDGAFQMPAYAAVQVLADAITAVGKEDPEAVANYMHKNSFNTGIGKVEFDAKGDLKNFDFGVFVWAKDGTKKAVK